MSRQPLVLLVPPDRLTGMTTSHHLAAYGLEIITARSVEEARNLLRAHRCISVLVIDTDLGQANDGLSLAKSARVSDPDLKMIYTGSEQEQFLLTRLVRTDRQPFR
jgi:DNA-binding NtrC family response regulator